MTMKAIEGASKRINALFRRGKAIFYRAGLASAHDLSPEAVLVLSQLLYWFSLPVDRDGFLNERDFRFPERRSDTQFTTHERHLIRVRAHFLVPRLDADSSDWAQMQEAYTEHCRQNELRRSRSTDFDADIYTATGEYIRNLLPDCMFAPADTWKGWEHQLGLKTRQIKRLFEQLQSANWLIYYRERNRIVILPGERMRIEDSLADEIEIRPARAPRRRLASFPSVTPEVQMEGGDSYIHQILLPPRLVAACNHTVAPALLIQQSLYMLRQNRPVSTWYRTDEELGEYMHLTRKQLERARKWLVERGLMRIELRYARRSGPRRRATHYTLDLGTLDRLLAGQETARQRGVND